MYYLSSAINVFKLIHHSLLLVPPDQPRKSTGGEASRKSTKRKRSVELDGALNNPNGDLVGGQEYQYSEVAYGGIAPPVETEV